MCSALIEIQRQIDVLQDRWAVAKDAVRRERQALRDAKTLVEEALAAQQVGQQIAQSIQDRAHQRIAQVVSRCLEAVFDEPYEFKIAFQKKRGKTEAIPLFSRDGNEMDPMEASGGGVVDVAAFALRLICVILTHPSIRHVMVLDEPFKFASIEYRARIRHLVQTLSKEMGVQFIIITHIPELKCGTIIEVS